MNDTAEEIRVQMDETRSNLTEKLISLESQVSETVEITGTAVNATVESVHDTIETVAEAVQQTVHSVHDTFDVKRQFERHPLLMLGGAVFLGYLANGYLTNGVKASQHPADTVLPPVESEPARRTGPADASSSDETVPLAAALSAAFESGRNSSTWRELKSGAMTAAIEILQSVAVRVLPLVMEQFARVPGPQPGPKPGPVQASEQTPEDQNALDLKGK